ncbi:translation initiation factor IF-2 [Brachionus plicatilis]|uniref:Translation initiation factor IF-2 n=1 Tax=Brachionus plicatilis TaxID=10195 RepID=A0A3M7T305_BRAPC|nr:translation initiation factor IF-2 [Brachionus plicatilis]
MEIVVPITESSGTPLKKRVSRIHVVQRQLQIYFSIYGSPPNVGGMPIGGPPYGDRPIGAPPYGDKPIGAPPYGDRPIGAPPYGDRPIGAPPYGDRPIGAPPYGEPYCWDGSTGTTGMQHLWASRTFFSQLSVGIWKSKLAKDRFTAKYNLNALIKIFAFTLRNHFYHRAWPNMNFPTNHKLLSYRIIWRIEKQFLDIVCLATARLACGGGLHERSPMVARLKKIKKNWNYGKHACGDVLLGHLSMVPRCRLGNSIRKISISQYQSVFSIEDEIQYRNQPVPNFYFYRLLYMQIFKKIKNKKQFLLFSTDYLSPFFLMKENNNTEILIISSSHIILSVSQVCLDALKSSYIYKYSLIVKRH